MTAPLPGFNPLLTTTAANTFNSSSEGFIAGSFMDDPAIRNQLAGGILGTSETIPMWGGVAIYENIPAAGLDELGPTVGRATNVTANTTLTYAGFSVFNQAANWVNNPQSQVPVAASGMTVPYFRKGSNARIIVPCLAALSSIDGGASTQQVSWDFNAQQLTQYNAAWNANVMTNSVYSSNKVTFTTTSSHGVSVGSNFTVFGSTPSGYNGDYVALTGTTGSTLIATSVNGSLGSISTEGTLAAGGGALPVTVLSINTNGLVPSYSSSTGYVNWLFGQTTALIEI